MILEYTEPSKQVEKLSGSHTFRRAGTNRKSLNHFNFLHLFIWAGTHVPHMWLEDNLWVQYSLYVGSGDHTQVIQPCGKCFLPAEPSHQPKRPFDEARVTGSLLLDYGEA